ncbi:MAG: ABC transporter permease subunit, partial [Actinomycetota bacterium]|nr:ABC transporter permease subunit [Actinomycetota bacterium]
MAVTTIAVGSPPVASAHAVRWRRLVIPVAVIAAICVVGAWLGDEVPTWIDAHVRSWSDDVYDWTVRNNGDHWLFTRILEPIADALTAGNDVALWVLRHLRWPGVLTLVALIGWRTGGTRAAIVGGLAMAGCGVLGFWDETMVTIALMLVAVLVALMIGIPLGILAGRHDRAERALRGVLDTAQVMPAFVYFLPVVVAFGIRTPAAVIATVIYATAPAVRLTSLGLRSVPVVATEVGNAFGCTSRQLLTKVQLPMARRAMLLGLNQV